MEKLLKLNYQHPEVTLIVFNDEGVVKTSGISTGKQGIDFGENADDIIE